MYPYQSILTFMNLYVCYKILLLNSQVPTYMSSRAMVLCICIFVLFVQKFNKNSVILVYVYDLRKNKNI